MALSMQEKQHVGKEVALRYLHARKKEKGVMLQEFCATTGYSPPYAAYLLRTYAKRVILGAVTLVPTRPSPWPRERKHVYGPAVVVALVWMYHLAGELCGKRLQAAMPELLRAMARHGTALPDPLSAALLQMGSATMDRLLRAEKAKGGNRRHAPRTKPGSLLRLIPIVSFRELSAAAPGSVEVDLVSHDGGKAAGDHCYTLTVTDRCSGWTEIVPVPSRAQVVVFAALTSVLTHLPFPVQLLHSDNGSEFINDELRRFCDAHGIRFTPEPFGPRRGALSVPVPTTKTTTVTWRARTGPSSAGAWAIDGSIPRVSSQTFSSWRPCLPGVPTSSSPPWPSSRRSGPGSTPQERPSHWTNMLGGLGPKGSGQQDPEEIPYSPHSPAPTPASSRGQRSGKGTTPASTQGDRSPLPAAGHRYPAGTAPRHNQPGSLPRSRDKQDHFAMIPR